MDADEFIARMVSAGVPDMQLMPQLATQRSAAAAAPPADGPAGAAAADGSAGPAAALPAAPAAAPGAAPTAADAPSAPPATAQPPAAPAEAGPHAEPAVAAPAASAPAAVAALRAPAAATAQNASAGGAPPSLPPSAPVGPAPAQPLAPFQWLVTQVPASCRCSSIMRSWTHTSCWHRIGSSTTFTSIHLWVDRL